MKRWNFFNVFFSAVIWSLHTAYSTNSTEACLSETELNAVSDVVTSKKSCSANVTKMPIGEKDSPDYTTTVTEPPDQLMLVTSQTTTKDAHTEENIGSAYERNITRDNGTVTNNSSSSNTTCNGYTSPMNFSEILQIPDKNGTRYLNFSMLLNEIARKSNWSRRVDTSKGSCTGIGSLSGIGNNLSQFNSTTHHSLPSVEQKPHNNSQFGKTGINPLFNSSNGVPVIVVKFQVSGLNSQGVASSPGRPPLLIDNHVASSPSLQNTSKILNDLCGQEKADNFTLKLFADTVTNAVQDRAIANEPGSVQKDLFTDIMSVAEQLINNLMEHVKDVHVFTESLDVISTLTTQLKNTSVKFLELENVRDNVYTKLSTSVLNHTSATGVRISMVTYTNMGTIVKASNHHISSPVVSVIVQYLKESGLEKAEIKGKGAITIEMNTYIEQGRKELKRICTYWDSSHSIWSSSGCMLINKNLSHTTCECNHLSNFAILVMYVEKKPISLHSEQALLTITTVGCSLSIACLLMNLITYVYLRMLSNEKVMIHANLSLALLLSQLVFVSSNDAHNHPTACKVVAVMLHFLFMASFAWMMVEGIALYLCCTKGIFHRHDMRVKYFLLGWGLPLVIVVISLVAKFPSYGKGPQYSCWLSVKDGLIWAFLGPMLVIVLLNMLVMGLVVKVFLTLKAVSQKTEADQLKGSLRAILTLLPLLGLTWILSLLVPFSITFHYLFVIINTVQGMCIFFLHCICNEEIRKKLIEVRRRWSTTRTVSDVEISIPSRRKTGSFDTMKVTGAVRQQLTLKQGRRTSFFKGLHLDLDSVQYRLEHLNM